METDEQVCRLLLVEDNPADAALTEAILETANFVPFETETAPSLNSALRTLREDEFDAVILDLNLPDSRGVDTLIALREDYPQVPVVVVSGVNPEGLRDEVLRHGAQEYIWKNEPDANFLARCILYAVERFRAQEAHRQVRQLIDANPDAVIVVDMQGTVRYLNDAAGDLFAATRETLVGEWLGFSIERGKTSEIEILGHERPITAEIRVADIAWQGEPAMLASIRDVTENRLLSEQLREAQKMEAVGMLAGGIAHDFNNLLVVIMGNTEFLLDICEEGDPRREMIERIDSAAERARHLTRQLLVFSRRQPSRPIVIDPNEAVLRLYNMLRRSFPKDIEFVFLPAEDPVWPIWADPNEIDQLLMNLTLNAKHAMPNGGRVQVDITNTRLSVPRGRLPAGEYVRMRVIDNGTGIAAEHLPRIFDPFFTTKPVGSGSGLGLSICHSIVMRAGGDIWAESDPGSRTTFTVLLPRCGDEPTTSISVNAFARRPRGDETILVVEDDAAVASAITQALTLSGYHVIYASTGEQAHRILSSGTTHIDLVLSDIVMPQMTGHELAAWLTKAQPEMRLLLMTGYTENFEALEAETSATRGYLLKPFLPTQLVRAVRDLLDRPPA
ncbi:response regulator [Acuticoccus sp. M5D2P5]|uniref:hybrid sensor histidine kinase/response regulator n=1 Tax=Acuticoccus kalidii TaxID=2910977 RepID=UPI001F2E49D6|nr:response regulator [Acuticoccus kalidii]MCF3933024.1 response regulator [Acuticoccus kalidii]